MSTLLKIDVSPRGEYSISRKLGNHFASEWQSNHVGGANKVAQGESTEPVFLDKFIHDIDLATSK